MKSNTSQSPPADMKAPKTLTEFTLFPKLPPELRLRIWKFSLSEPRTVVLSVTLQATSRGEPLYKDATYKSITAPPTGLGVCSESRVEYLKAFELLPTTLYCPSLRGDGALMYFAGNRDIFELPGRALTPYRRDGVFGIDYRDIAPSGWKGSQPLEHFGGISHLRVNIYNWIASEVVLFIMNFSMVATEVKTVTLFIDRNDSQRVMEGPIANPFFFDNENSDNADSLRDKSSLLAQVLPNLNAGLAHFKPSHPKWKTVTYDSHERIIIPKQKSPIVSEALAAAGTTSGHGPRRRVMPQELVAAVPVKGITPTDLMNRLNKTHYPDNPFQDANEFLAHCNAWEHVVLGVDNMLRLIGKTKLILEWA